MAADQPAVGLSQPRATCGPPLVGDDIFGPKTEQAVKGYQSAHLVAANGIVGVKTWVIHISAAGAIVADEVGVKRRARRSR